MKRFSIKTTRTDNVHSKFIKKTQGHCQPTKESIGYNLPLHTHDEDNFHHPQNLKIASGTHAEWILNRDKKLNEIYQKKTKKLLRRIIKSQINSRFTTATNLKIGIYVLIPNFSTQKRISKKIQPLREGPYQIYDKPTDVTYKLLDLNKKENCSTPEQSFTLLSERKRSSRTDSILLLYKTQSYSQKFRLQTKLKH